jgi:hypothetical protein
MHECLHAWMFTCMNIYMHECIHPWMFTCMYVCMRRCCCACMLTFLKFSNRFIIPTFIHSFPAHMPTWVHLKYMYDNMHPYILSCMHFISAYSCVLCLSQLFILFGCLWGNLIAGCVLMFNFLAWGRWKAMKRRNLFIVEIFNTAETLFSSTCRRTIFHFHNSNPAPTLICKVKNNFWVY